MAAVRHVLIVGGGIAGMTLAAALQRRGIAADVIEKAPGWESIGAGIAVQPNGMRALRTAGLDDLVVSAGRVLERWWFRSSAGDILTDVELGAAWQGIAPFVGIARHRLQDALVAGVQGVPVRLGTSLTRIEQEPDSVIVTLSDGTSKGYDLVVGADGISSKVRALALEVIEPQYLGALAWRALAPVGLEGPPRVEFWLGDGCFFGLCSTAESETYGFGNVTQDRSHDPLRGRLERLRERFKDFGHGVRVFLEHLEHDDQIHCSAIEWVDNHRWHNGRVVLIGDAAHASSPMMGQGGCLAMEDAVVLAEELSSHPDLNEALDSYALRRHPRVRWVQDQSRRLGETFRMPIAERDAALRTRGKAMFYERYAPLIPEP